MSRRRARLEDLGHDLGHDFAAAAAVPAAHGTRPCPGPCNRQWRAAEQAAADEADLAKAEERLPVRAVVDHGVKPALGMPVWCIDVPHFTPTGDPIPGPPEHRGCTERILWDLRQIESLAALLLPGQLDTPRDVKVDDRGLGSSTIVNPPSNSPAWDEADALIRWAVALEDHLRARLGDLDQVRRLKRRTLSGAVGYLSVHGRDLLGDPRDGEAAGRQIMGWKRSLEQDTGRSRLVHRLPGTCLVCDRKGLRRADGDDWVRCPSCGACWDWDHYGQLAKAYAEDVRRRGL